MILRFRYRAGIEKQIEVSLETELLLPNLMAAVKTIVAKVCLEPDCLASNLKTKLIEKVRSALLNDCTKEHGYILRVIKLAGILDNNITADCAIHEDRVTSTCQIVFKVKVVVKALKPEEGHVYASFVHGVLSQGVLVSVEGKMKVLIPNPIEGWDYVETALQDRYYQNKDDATSRIRAGDTVSVLLQGTKYRDKAYRSYGKLVSAPPNTVSL